MRWPVLCWSDLYSHYLLKLNIHVQYCDHLYKQVSIKSTQHSPGCHWSVKQLVPPLTHVIGWVRSWHVGKRVTVYRDCILDTLKHLWICCDWKDEILNTKILFDKIIWLDEPVEVIIMLMTHWCCVAWQPQTATVTHVNYIAWNYDYY